MGEGVSGVNDAPDTKCQRSPLPLLTREVIRRLRKIFLLQLPLGLMPKHVVSTFRSSRLFPKLTGANSDLLLGRNCHGAFPQCRVGFSLMMTSDTSGSSARLHWQGSRTPHVQPNSSCQAWSGWLSQTDEAVLVHTASYSARALLQRPQAYRAPARLHLRSRNLQLLPNRRGRVADLFDRSARLIWRNMEAAPPVLQLRWLTFLLRPGAIFLRPTIFKLRNEKARPHPRDLRSRVDEATPARATQSACPAEPMRKCQARSSPRERLASRTSNKNPGKTAGAGQLSIETSAPTARYPGGRIEYGGRIWAYGLFLLSSSLHSAWH